MKPWLMFSLLAMLSWGSYIVVAKVATSEEYCGLSARWSAALMYLGIGIVFTAYWMMSKGDGENLNVRSTFAGIGSGALWALGMLFSLWAIKSGADVSRLAPIYNCNTLVAVFLGIVLLHEIGEASDILRVICGSVLIVVGGILVAR